MYMEVVRISPRGYCYGVVDAMVIARNAALSPTLPRPIYILGMIVHNKYVTDAFEKEGIITLDGYSRKEIIHTIQTGTVIFTAHGISPEVREIAKQKGLTIIDASCPDVIRTHDLITEKVQEGYHILYIGKAGHPEPEGVIGIAPDSIHLIQKIEDVHALRIPTKKLFVTNQTTMSQWDVAHLIKEIQHLYPWVECHNEVCLATQIRQEAVAQQAIDVDLTIVVGDPRSNNSNRLAQVSEEIAHTSAYRVADVHEIDINWLKGVKKVAVTSGASTPTPLTKAVITFLEQFDEQNPETWKNRNHVELDNILPKVKENVQRKKELI